MNSNPMPIALIWIGAIVFIVGAIVGLTPVDDNFGSAWFPAPSPPGIHASSMGISIVLLLIGAAAGITGMVLHSQRQSSKK